MNTQYRRTSAPPPFLRGLTPEEVTITRCLFTQAAKVGPSDTPSGVASCVFGTAQMILQEHDPDFYPCIVVRKILARMEQTPACALRYAQSIVDELIAEGGR